MKTSEILYTTYSVLMKISWAKKKKKKNVSTDYKNNRLSFFTSESRLGFSSSHTGTYIYICVLKKNEKNLPKNVQLLVFFVSIRYTVMVLISL